MSLGQEIILYFMIIPMILFCIAVLIANYIDVLEKRKTRKIKENYRKEIEKIQEIKFIKELREMM